MHHGNGWTHSDVYTMPVYLRRFYLDLLKQAKELEVKSMKARDQKIQSQIKSRKR